MADAERERLVEADAGVAWRRWGPYLSDRQWGTVREDRGDGPWSSFPHEQARYRAYRWGEDGLAGICDDRQRLCLAPALWNGADPMLKERLFGLTNAEGNHGEDVKECYFYLDATPTSSYLKMLYKYPQAPFPYEELVAVNGMRDRTQPEYELLDTGIFDDHRYFDIVVEYAKAGPDDVLMRVTAHNRGPDDAELHVLPTLWFRHTWSWAGGDERPVIQATDELTAVTAVRADHHELGTRWLYADRVAQVLVTGNETDNERVFGSPNDTPYVKDGIDRAVVHGDFSAVDPTGVGTKAAIHHALVVRSGDSVTLRFRLTDTDLARPGFGGDPFEDFDQVMDRRRDEADEFYGTLTDQLSDDERLVVRQALAGMLWSKQYYALDMERWLVERGADPLAADAQLRNREWRHLLAEDVISMPDKWEYPWFAAWDLAFHAVAIAPVDPAFAKHQLDLLLDRRYLHPNGQLPAYEWNFGDVNPPVHAWAALRVFRIDRRINGRADRRFLERVFHKLLLNFTWWVNRKDAEGNNIFEGGFLGLDNIGVFDRSNPPPGASHLEQSDATSWMAMYTLNMLAIAMELATEDTIYEDIATKFFEHFLYIAHAMTDRGDKSLCLWDEQDGFFYDVLFRGGDRTPMRVRSMVGLIPLFAVETIEPSVIEKLPGFRRRMEWFLENRPDLTNNVASMHAPGRGDRRLLSIADADQLRRILSVALDEREFLSPYGVRALSRIHAERPYVLRLDGGDHVVDYEPAESTTGLFGGNSNWRGPIWFPVNYLLIESIQKFHYYFGDDYLVECPAGSGRMLTLWEIATELSQRLSSIFLRRDGRRAVYGTSERFQRDPHWRDLILFHEYFHGDNGSGLGASHQTGWTAIVAKLLEQSGEPSRD